MLKHSVTEVLVDVLPLWCAKALLVQVVKIALNLNVALIVVALVAYSTTFHDLIALAACCVFQRAAESLELIKLFLYK